MKKLFLFVALLCASVMVSAADYCSAPIKSTADHDATVTMRLVSGSTYEFSITTADNIVSFNAAGSNLYAEVNGVGGYHLSEYLTQSGNTLSAQFESTVKPKIYANALFIVLDGIGENLFNIPMDADWEICGEAKTDPELSLNATEIELNANVSETFQIEVDRKGTGAISYESNNAGIASVSESGLVKAVGRGVATITVKSAETADYALGVKTLKVTVTGKVNWDAVAWLAGGNEKYKVISAPEIPDQFGGKHIENNNLWIGFPSAVWGDNSSIDHSAVGAGVSFPLSQFTKEFNTFDFICENVTYAITLYWVDGEKSETGVEDQFVNSNKIVKIIENGQIVIIKNGVRYSLLGQKE